MTAAQKAGARLLFQFIVLVLIIITMGLHWLFLRFKEMRTGIRIRRISSFRRSDSYQLGNPGKKSTSVHFESISAQYFPVIVRFISIAYTTAVLVPLEMLQCIRREDGSLVWWFDAKETCYSSWQYGAFIAIAILIPLPLVLGIIMYYRILAPHSRIDVSEWRITTQAVLSKSFRDERRWWLSVSLYRRLIIVIAYTSFTDFAWRAMAMTVLCIIFLGLNLLVRPFQSRVTHTAESCSLFVLCLLSVAASPQLSHLQFGATRALSDEMALEAVQLFLILLPIVAYAVLSTRRIGRKVLRKLLSADSAAVRSLGDNNNAPEVIRSKSGEAEIEMSPPVGKRQTSVPGAFERFADSTPPQGGTAVESARKYYPDERMYVPEVEDSIYENQGNGTEVGRGVGVCDVIDEEGVEDGAETLSNPANADCNICRKLRESGGSDLSPEEMRMLCVDSAWESEICPMHRFC